MATLTLNNIVSATGSPGNFDAAPFSTNCKNISTVLDSQLDSANYSTQGFLSQHVQNNAIQSAKISDSQVVVGKIGSQQVGEGFPPKMEFRTASDGVRAVRAVNSLIVQRLSWTQAVENAGTSVDDRWISTVVVYSDNNPDGHIAYTSAPSIMANPMQHPDTSVASVNAPYYWIVSDVNNTSCTFRWYNSTPLFTRTETFHVVLAGMTA